jgi:hypothetical protein
MILEPSHIRLIASGKKTEIRERNITGPRPPYKVGDLFGVKSAYRKPKRFDVEVLEVDAQLLGDVTYREAVAEGYRTRDELWDWWKENDPAFNLNLEVWVYRIRIYGDHPRLLVPSSSPRGTEKGYTTQPGRAMFDSGNLESEPEALSDEQHRKLQGWRSAVHDIARVEPLLTSADRIQQELDSMKQNLQTAPDRAVSKSLRAVEHHMAALQRRLAS